MKGFERPEITVLSESSAIPAGHIVQPPESPTHELTRDQEYWYERESSAEPNGILAAGTKVLLIAEDDTSSQVVEPRGLIVTIDKGALRKL